MGTAVAHYTSLVVAEHPLEQHKEYLERLEEQPGDEELTTVLVESSGSGSLEVEHTQLLGEQQMSDSRSRWRKAVESIVSSTKLLENAVVLTDIDSGGADRFAALVNIERMLHDNPHKKLLMRALALKQSSHAGHALDLFFNEILQTGECIFDFFTPAEIGRHMVLFTYAMTASCFFVFFYMVGAHPLYKLQSEPDAAACMAAAKPRWIFLSWMVRKGAAWCFKGPGWVMDATYLRDWGARYGPLMKHEPSRWFSAWFVHQSFLHITSNMALFLVVAHQIEEKYGTWRITLLYFISALGGSFFSAAFENGCKTVQGASGGVFGMMGLFIADLVLNFETVKRLETVPFCPFCLPMHAIREQLSRPLLRGLLLLAFLVYFIVGAVTSSGSNSLWSHVGGFLCGLFPSFLFLPNLKSERWEQILPLLGGTVLLGVFIALPVYVYRERLPMLDCPS